MTVPATKEKPAPEELVKQHYPLAFVEDDGDYVYIRVRRPVTETCPTCGQEWTHTVTDYSRTLGSGGTAAYAWKNAAHNLGLI